MAKVKITGLDRAARKVKLEIGRAIKASNFEVEMRQSIIDEIRENGIEPGLTQSSVKNRKYLAQYNSTHKDFRPEDSNLTLTGQLLEGLKVKFLVAKFSFVVDSLKTKHKRYKTGSNKGKSKLPSLREVFEYQSKMGRDIGLIFNRNKFLNQLTKLLTDAIRKHYRN